MGVEYCTIHVAYISTQSRLSESTVLVVCCDHIMDNDEGSKPFLMIFSLLEEVCSFSFVVYFKIVHESCTCCPAGARKQNPNVCIFKNSPSPVPACEYRVIYPP
jgi:hypothetical protein